MWELVATLVIITHSLTAPVSLTCLSLRSGFFLSGPQIPLPSLLPFYLANLHSLLQWLWACPWGLQVTSGFCCHPSGDRVRKKTHVGVGRKRNTDRDRECSSVPWALQLLHFIVLCLASCVSVLHLCGSDHRGQNREFCPLELEVQTVMSLHEDTETWTWVPWKSSQYSNH